MSKFDESTIVMIAESLNAQLLAVGLDQVLNKSNSSPIQIFMLSRHMLVIILMYLIEYLNFFLHLISIMENPNIISHLTGLMRNIM